VSATQALTKSSPLKGLFMNKSPDPKSMAKSLRSELSIRKIDITHSTALEIVARQFGVNDWNVLAAKLGNIKAPEGIYFERAYPILRIFDEAKAKEFYIGFLGFTLDWEHRFGDNFPLYCQISRASLTLHLSGHHGDASPGSSVFIGIKGLRQFQTELSTKDFKYAKPTITEQAWGDEMKITDPFSNSLRFCESKSSIPNLHCKY